MDGKPLRLFFVFFAQLEKKICKLILFFTTSALDLGISNKAWKCLVEM